MSRSRHTAQQEPRLLHSYLSANRDAADAAGGVHRHYLAAWRRWHAETCGRDRCELHIDTVTETWGPDHDCLRAAT